MAVDDLPRRSVSRRTALKAGVGVALASQLAMLEQLAVASNRPARATNAGPFPIIQFDIGNFVHAPQTFNDGAGNVIAQFGVTFALFVPIRLTRTPTHDDQRTMNDAL